MKILGLLVKLRLLEMFSSFAKRTSGNGKKRSPVILILLALLLVYAVAVFMFLFFGLFSMLWMVLSEGGGDLSFFFGIVGLLTLAFCVFGSVLTTQSALYHARDNELMLSMPVPPVCILFSRMLFLFILNTSFSVVVTRPALIVYLIFGRPSIIAAIGFCFFYFLLSIIALAISCLLGWLVALVTARMKHKNIFSLIFSLLFLVLYFGAIMSLNSGMENIEINIRPLVEALSPYLTAFMWVGRALLYGDVIAGALFMLVFAGIVGLTITFLARTYIHILTTNRSGVHYTYRERKIKQRSITAALVKKEVTHFVNNATYMLNEGLGLLFAVGVSIYFFLARDNVLAMLEELELPALAGILPPASAGVLCLCASMVIISAPSVSLEGKSIWLAQSLPIPGGRILCAKAYAHLAVASPFFALSSVFCIIATGAGVLEAIGLLLLPFAFNAFCAFLGVTLNVIFPKLDWVNETYAVKTGVSVMLTMFSVMLIAGGMTVGFILLSVFGVPGWAVMLGGTALFCGVALILRAYLYGAGAKRFAAL